MKRSILFLACLAISSILIVGCKSTPKVESPELAGEYANAPSWVLDPTMEGGLSALGISRVGKAGMQFARTEAIANGRDELARIISVKVKNLIKNFTETTGIGDEETVDKVSSQVSKQVASQTLNGSRSTNMWVSPKNNLHILVVLDPSSVADVVKENVETSYKNERALWQKFQAKKAHEELDKEIEKEFGEFKSQ